MADELRGGVSEADVAAVVRNNPGAVVDAIRNQAIEPSEVESDSSSAGVSDVEELLLKDANTALLNDGYVVSATGVSADPDASSNAVQDVIDATATDEAILLPDRTVPYGTDIRPKSGQYLWGPSCTLQATADVDGLVFDGVSRGGAHIHTIDVGYHAGHAVRFINSSKFHDVYVDQITSVGPQGDGGNAGQNAVEMGQAWGIDFDFEIIWDVEGKGIYHNGTGGNTQSIRGTIRLTGGEALDLANQAGMGNETYFQVETAGDRQGDGTFNDVRGATLSGPGMHYGKAESIGGHGIFANGNAFYPYLGVHGYGFSGSASDGVNASLSTPTVGFVQEKQKASGTTDDGVKLAGNLSRGAVLLGSNTENNLNVVSDVVGWFDPKEGWRVGGVGDTLIRAEMSTDQNLTAGNFATVEFDSEATDVRGEWDTAAYAFTPDETGEYSVVTSARFGVAADQDLLFIRLRNTTDGATVPGSIFEESASGNANTTARLAWEGELAAGKSYIVEMQNNSNDDTLDSNTSFTRLAISRIGR